MNIPVIETERLRLRAPVMGDFEDYAAFCSGPRSHWLGGPYPRPEAFRRFSAIIGHWPLRGYGRWLVADRETDQPLGVIGPYYPVGWPEPEIAWAIFDAAEGKGVAYEAASAALRYAYDTLGWTTAISAIEQDNTRSERLAQRLGAVRDGNFTHAVHGVLNVWRHSGPEALS